ncbi:MAG TPA: BNR-repeat neuraminidase N-terminal domain-containing protein [Bacteroidia bacterium]|nr:BNR-repeat neuraminidase N-terminal domain-containing protein [Bacteroidia bacterium]
MFKRKKLLSQTPSMRTNLRMAMYIGSASLSGLVVLLLIVFNISKREISKAEYSGMQVINTEVFQNTDVVYRGSVNNPIIGIMIDVKGYKTAVKLNSITFSLKGTTQPYFKQVENIKVWSSGQAKTFSGLKQLYQSIAPSEGNVRIDINSMLSPGINYLWISTDIKTSAMPAAVIDAELTSLTVNGSSLLPLLASAPGNKKIRNNTVLFSVRSGNFNDLSVWNTQRNGKGSTPSTVTPNTCFFIQGGHEFTLSESDTSSIAVVENKGKLNCDKYYALKEVCVEQGAIFQLNENENKSGNLELLILKDGSNYIHNSTGSFASEHAQLSNTSQVVFMKYGNHSFGKDVAWGNVMFDAAQGVDANIGKAFRNIYGNLELRNTGKGSLFTEGVNIMSVKGDFIVSGGSFEGVRNVNSKLVLNVGGSFKVLAGNISDVVNKTTPGARTTFNLYGDVMLLGGKIMLNNADDDGSFINIMGHENPQVRWMQTDKAQVELCNVAIKPEKELFLKGDKIGDIPAGRLFSVERNAKLWCAALSVTGQGRFSLADNATLGIGHSKGINSEKSEGNILTKERQFSSGANYIYYMAVSPQTMGEFVTFPKEKTIRNLVIKKDSPMQQVNLASDLFVSDQVKVSMGDFNRGSFKLQLSDVSESLHRLN